MGHWKKFIGKTIERIEVSSEQDYISFYTTCGSRYNFKCSTGSAGYLKTFDGGGVVKDIHQLSKSRVYYVSQNELETDPSGYTVYKTRITTNNGSAYIYSKHEPLIPARGRPKADLWQCPGLPVALKKEVDIVNHDDCYAPCSQDCPAHDRLRRTLTVELIVTYTDKMPSVAALEANIQSAIADGMLLEEGVSVEAHGVSVYKNEDE